MARFAPSNACATDERHRGAAAAWRVPTPAPTGPQSGRADSPAPAKSASAPARAGLRRNHGNPPPARPAVPALPPPTQRTFPASRIGPEIPRERPRGTKRQATRRIRWPDGRKGAFQIRTAPIRRVQNRPRNEPRPAPSGTPIFPASNGLTSSTTRIDSRPSRRAPGSRRRILPTIDRPAVDVPANAKNTIRI